MRLKKIFAGVLALAVFLNFAVLPSSVSALTLTIPRRIRIFRNPPPPPPPGSQPATTQPGTTSTAESRNWAGYTALSGNYTSVSGTWTVPTVAYTGHTASDAVWVGIGGIKSGDLIQSGTQDVITAQGKIYTTAWVEMLPAGSQTIPLAVKSGDSVSVSLTNIGGNSWNLNFKNNTTGENYDTALSYSSSFASAEWIVESPSNDRTVLPLDNFGTINFSASTTDNNPISRAGGRPVTMVNSSGTKIAVPSSLGADGESFNVTRTNAPSSAPNPAYDQNPSSWQRQGQGLGSSNNIQTTSVPKEPDTYTFGIDNNLLLIIGVIILLTAGLNIYYFATKPSENKKPPKS